MRAHTHTPMHTHTLEKQRTNGRSAVSDSAPVSQQQDEPEDMMIKGLGKWLLLYFSPPNLSLSVAHRLWIHKGIGNHCSQVDTM